MCFGRGFSYDERLESDFARDPQRLTSKEIMDLQLFRIARYYEAEGRRVWDWGNNVALLARRQPKTWEEYQARQDEVRRLQIRRAPRDEMRESVTEELLWRRTTT